MYLHLDALGKSAPGNLKIAYTSKHSVSLPDSGTAMLTVDAVFANVQLPNTYYPKEHFEVLNNPFVGWSTRGTGGDRPQPHSLLYAGITWRELEPQKGLYDWNALESKYQFDYWRSQGKRFILRITMDEPADDPNHKDIPDWLYDMLVAAEGEQNAGKWYSSPSRRGFSPNYNSAELIQEHERLIRAFAAKYDQDPIVAFIQIGSLGHWGEFHNSPESEAGKFPNVSVSDQYVTHYLNSFSRPLIGMRKPFPIAAQNNLGLFNDVFGDRGSTDAWLDWIRIGWKGIKNYIDSNQDPNAIQEASKMHDFWKTNFSGGEFANSNSREALQDDTIMETLRQARLSHTSWLGPSSPVSLRLGTDIQEDVQANIDLLHKTIGYRFVLESVTAVTEASAGDTIAMNAVWNNKGVAPFYYNWPVAYALADPSGNLVASSVTSAGTDIRSWLQGKANQTANVAIPHDLPRGTYKLLVAILDPDTGKPGVSLAIEGKRADGWYPLQSIAIDNPVDAPPTMPTNLRAVGKTENSIELAWNASYDDIGVAGYEIQTGNGSVTTVTASGYRAAGLTGATSYTFTVRAYDTSGQRSAASGIGGVADRWSASNSSSVAADLQVVTSSVYLGSKAQQLTGTNIGIGSRIAVRQTVTVEPNKPFTLSGYVYAKELNQAKVQLYVDFTDSGQLVSNVFAEHTDVTPAYIEIGQSGTVPATAVKANVYVILRGTGNSGSGTVYADEITFRYGSAEAPDSP